MGRFINADEIDLLGADGSLTGYNIFAYCENNPVTGYDPNGTLDFGNLLQGSSWIVAGVTVIAVGVSVLTCGVAAPAMMVVAAVTVAAGAATAVNGVSELGEVVTGHNFMRDDVFDGNSAAYYIYANAIATVAEIGTVICGGWLKANQTRIADHKLEQIINNPESVKRYNPQQFQKIANQSSWNSGISANGKGFRAFSGDYSIRYNMNGTRLDAMHFGGKPYWVISSAAKGTVKIPF